ncbi:uncharacterized protein CDAR_321501 [Caerostris darwini]|uniref:Uncharacterized protein n=1 Tax=Caerostris darwini TaxID=1538125 RepID=A0AAV4U1G2_9ARAC|nr:uncharacterized protein CDAR_321501 [Caerostris darwini]
MSTFNPETEDRQADSSNSSPGGLREFLFPPRHDGEIIYKAPPSVVAFAGQVFSTSRAGYRANSVTEPKVPRPGAAARHSDPVNATMEWDYFESRRYSTSEVSNEPGYNGINICWV